MAKNPAQSSRFILHSLFLIAAVVLAYIWTTHPELSYYTLQLTAVFILFFFLNQFISRRRRQRVNLTIDAVIFTMVILLLVSSTGGLTSPLFFLIYFLMFGLALLFEPTEILQLFSLLLITPLALFFGRQYLQLLESEEKIKILEEESQILEGEIEKEETDTLLWTTLELKKDLADILDRVSTLLADVGHLTVRQKENLEKIREKAKNLLKTGQKLKEEVDKTTDES